MINLFLQHFRFHLDPKAPLRMPAHNKGNVIRGGFGSTFRRIVCHVNCRELPGERLSFDLVLAGKIKDYLPYFIVTFKELSQAGLGRGRRELKVDILPCAR